MTGRLRDPGDKGRGGQTSRGTEPPQPCQKPTPRSSQPSATQVLPDRSSRDSHPGRRKDGEQEGQNARWLSWPKGHQPAPAMYQLLASAKEQGQEGSMVARPSSSGVTGWLPRFCPGEPGGGCTNSTGPALIDVSSKPVTSQPGDLEPMTLPSLV